jgi:hypothetical protein
MWRVANGLDNAVLDHFPRNPVAYSLDLWTFSKSLQKPVTDTHLKSSAQLGFSFTKTQVVFALKLSRYFRVNA